ncbi:two-component system, sensor histidine kinase YesM [Enterococcus sp. AZ194]|uniref:sensor histidine kinase n=1 Tax=Enterococcus sp. AZ194 TaxID=2774629 RepID=UPI003F258F4C
MKKMKVNSIKGLTVIYFLFIFAVFFSFLAIKFFTIQTTEQMLVENTETQIKLLDDKLQTDLTGVQLRIWSLLSNEQLTSYKNRSAVLKKVTEKLRLDGEIKKILKESIASSSIIGALDAYWPKEIKRITSADSMDLEKNTVSLFSEAFPNRKGWILLDNQGLYYVGHAPFSLSKKYDANAEFSIVGKVKKDYIDDFLHAYESNDYLHVFLLSDDAQTYSNTPVEREIVDSLKTLHNKESLYSYTVNNNAGKFQVTLKRNSLSGLWIVSYFDMNHALAQHRQVNEFSSVILVLLLVIASMVSVIFYKKFFSSLNVLIRKFQAVEKGDYGVRIKKDSHRLNEFTYVFSQFNQMIFQTEDLIEQLKTEMSLRETAEIRQLQAQINPHFLYNNLLFIMSMATSSPKAVISMTEHLSAYYRYLTTQTNTTIRLEQECLLAHHYLTIMSLRKNLDFQIIVPEKVKEEAFIPLILQPIIENAIQHGIEKKIGAHIVQLIIVEVHAGINVQIIDDGKGLIEEERVQLMCSLNNSLSKDSESIGLWNVNKRLVNHYGTKSRLNIEKNTYGGVTVSFFIPIGESK